MKEDQRWVSKAGGEASLLRTQALSILLGAASFSAYGFHSKVQGVSKVEPLV